MSNSFLKTHKSSTKMDLSRFLVYVFIRIPVKHYKHYRMVGRFILPICLFAISLKYTEYVILILHKLNVMMYCI